MPKAKTRRGAAKRFKLSGTGKVMRRRAFKSHLLTGKKRKVKRRLGKSAVVAPGLARHVKAICGRAT